MLRKPAPDRTKMKRFTAPMRRRNQNFHEAVAFMSERKMTFVTDIQKHFGFKGPTAARVLLRILLQHELICVRSRATPLSSIAYALTDLGRETDLNKLFPLLESDVELVQDKPTSTSSVDGQTQRQLVDVRVHRDPLVAYIHGTGRAPSLNFIDSQAREAPC